MNITPVNNVQFGAVNVKAVEKGLVSVQTQARLSDLSKMYNADIWVSSVRGKTAKSYPKHHVLNIMATQNSKPNGVVATNRVVLVPKNQDEELVYNQITENAYDLVQRLRKKERI